jgi:YVTN family beta-propeller protein
MHRLDWSEMKACLVKLAASMAVLVATLASGLEPDWTIYVPDSLSGLMYSKCAVYNPVTDKVYVGGTGNCVIVIDCAANRKVARIPTKSGCSAMFCSPVNGRIYCVGDLLTVIDGASDTVVKTLRVSRAALCYNLRSEKLYAHGGRWGADSPIVIDTRTDSIVETVNVGTASLCYNPHDDKVYCKQDGHVQYRDFVTVLNGSDLSFVVNVPAKAGPGTLCYNPANNRVYCADNGTKTVTVIDGTTNAVLTTIAADSGLADMCCNPRNNRVYLANGAHAPHRFEGRGPRPDYGDSTVTVIDGVTDTVLATVRTHGRPMVLSYDSVINKVLVACEGGRVDFIDGESDSVTASAGLSQHTGAFSVDPKRGYAYCVASDRDHSGVVVLDVTTGRMIADLRTGRSPGALCYNSRRNKMYCTISVDSELMVLDGATNHVRARVALGRVPGRLCYNSRNDKLYCQVSEANQVLVLDGKTDEVKSKLDMGAPIWYNPQNNRVYSYKGIWNGARVVVTDGTTDSVIAEIPVPNAGAICSNPKTNTIYCAGGVGVAVIDGSENRLVTTTKVDGGASVLCCDYRYNRVYCANRWSAVLFVIDGATNRLDTALAQHGSTAALCYNPRNDKIYSSGNMGIRVFDATTDSVIARFTEYDAIGSMFYNPANNCVYCVGGGSVVVIDGATNEILRTYAVGRGSYALAFNTAQNRIYLANRDGISISVLNGDAVLSGSFGRLQISSVPSGAAISMDSTDTGTTAPHLFARVAAGQYSLGLTKKAYPGWDSTVMVTRGQTTTVQAILKSPPDSMWITYANWRPDYLVDWTGPERAVRFDPRSGFGYPLHITKVSAVFYLFNGKPWPKPWPDSSFHFKIYGGDGQALLYESPVLEANPGEPGTAVVHELSTPVLVDSGEFYVALAPVDTSGLPSSLVVSGTWRTPSAFAPIAWTDLSKRSYTGSPGHWFPMTKGELSVAVLVRR